VRVATTRNIQGEFRGDGTSGTKLARRGVSESARQDKYQGEAELRLTVAEDGRVRDVCVSQSVGEGLDEKSVAAIRNWKFEPGTKQGKPVPVRIAVTINFHLY
jgi:TonB family protein